MDLSMILPKDVKCKMAPKSENEKKKKRDTDAAVPNDVSCDGDDELGILKPPETRAANKVHDGKKRPAAGETKVKTPTKKSRTPAKKKKKTSSPTPAAPEQPEQPSFRSLNLPIAEFSCYDGETKNKSNDKNNENNSPTIKQEETKTETTPEGLKWQAACLRTRSHEKYASAFDFPKYQRLDSENGRGPPSAWITARPYGEWCASNPHAIAIDCEMCETRCPENGNTNPKALCRLSVVNAVDPREVLIDTLVKPDWPVVDYRSRINGIKKENLDKVKFTLKHAQTFMLALCSEETVIIGHAVHHDLVALKFQHRCNVDSAFLFTLKDEPESTCSLKDLAMTVLKKEMPDTHDSVNDARTAMQCIDEGYLQTNGRPEPIVRTFTPKSAGASNLLVHRIPKVCKRVTRIKDQKIQKKKINLKRPPRTHQLPQRVRKHHLQGVPPKHHPQRLQKHHPQLQLQRVPPKHQRRRMEKERMEKERMERIRTKIREKKRMERTRTKMMEKAKEANCKVSK